MSLADKIYEWTKPSVSAIPLAVGAITLGAFYGFADRLGVPLPGIYWPTLVHGSLWALYGSTQGEKGLYWGTSPQVSTIIGAGIGGTSGLALGGIETLLGYGFGYAVAQNL